MHSDVVKIISGYNLNTRHRKWPGVNGMFDSLLQRFGCMLVSGAPEDLCTSFSVDDWALHQMTP